MGVDSVTVSDLLPVTTGLLRIVTLIVFAAVSPSAQLSVPETAL